MEWKFSLFAKTIKVLTFYLFLASFFLSRRLSFFFYKLTE